MALRDDLWVTPEEYLEQERTAEAKSEYLDGRIFAMAGNTPDHVQIAVNLTLALGNRLKGTKCRVVNSEQRIRTPSRKTYTYPDLGVVCGDRKYEGPQPATLTNPTAIIEILSPATESFDRGDKFWRYAEIESLREYVLVSQDQPTIELRQFANGLWVFHAFRGIETDLKLSSIDVEIPMAEIYDGVVFPT